MGQIIDKALALRAPETVTKAPKVAPRVKKYRRRRPRPSKKLCIVISTESADVLRAIVNDNYGQAEAVEAALTRYFLAPPVVKMDADGCLLSPPLERFLNPPLVVEVENWGDIFR